MVTNENCPCKRLKCERHGDCDACREHHQTVNTKVLPACDRLKKKAERKAEKEVKAKKYKGNKKEWQ